MACRSSKDAIRSAPACGSSGIQDNEDTASRQLGQASFASLQTFLQGTVTSFQVVPDPNELGWRSFFGAAYFEDAIKMLSESHVPSGPALRIHHRLERRIGTSRQLSHRFRTVS